MIKEIEDSLNGEVIQSAVTALNMEADPTSGNSEYQAFAANIQLLMHATCLLNYGYRFFLTQCHKLNQSQTHSKLRNFTRNASRNVGVVTNNVWNALHQKVENKLGFLALRNVTLALSKQLGDSNNDIISMSQQKEAIVGNIVQPCFGSNLDVTDFLRLSFILRHCSSSNKKAQGTISSLLKNSSEANLSTFLNSPDTTSESDLIINYVSKLQQICGVPGNCALGSLLTFN